MTESILIAGERAPHAPDLPRGGFIELSPINQRRVDNFRANKRGYWSFIVFVVLFTASLFAEFIANERPILVSYKGELLMPVFKDYPEEKFGGFLAHTDYRDPVIQKEIEAHGWMVWPPIRYSFKTHNLDLPRPAPSPPTWALSQEECARAAAKKIGADKPNRGCADIEWNWFGTDDQGRDVVARLIYGFRISILFGLTLAIVSSIIGIFAGAVQGY